MIIWLASYPKSGNTWVRSFLANYINKHTSSFYFDMLKQILKFPRQELYDQLKIDTTKFTNIASNWINMQEFINLKQEFTYLKTHNAMCTVNNYSFTNKENTIGFIYLVRDPRDVILSWSHYLGKSAKHTYKLMIDKYNFNYSDEGNDETVLGSWSENYKSWRDYNSVKKIIIKYEDLILNPYENFLKIINYLNKINGLHIDEEMVKKSIENVSFEKLQNLEKKYGFNEKHCGDFFRKGKVGNWKNELDKEIASQIEEAFSEEMKELGYL
tara:strand:+ start:216 stop:1025 length:810 start_codon:yes stop_codon:yes gene_type:complete